MAANSEDAQHPDGWGAGQGALWAPELYSSEIQDRTFSPFIFFSLKDTVLWLAWRTARQLLSVRVLQSLLRIRVFLDLAPKCPPSIVCGGQRSHYEVLIGLEFATQITLASEPRTSACRACLPHPVLTGMNFHYSFANLNVGFRRNKALGVLLLFTSTWSEV